jgi:shikimate kinase/3-dehydroquinate synthase
MIVLVGFMGAGKSTVGSLVADRLGLPFVDTDALVEERAGPPVAQIFAEAGEPAFRALEGDVVAQVLGGADAVVALGGGATGDPATCAALQWTTVVYLDVTFSEAMTRAGSSDRPLLQTGDPKALFDGRRDTYKRVADVTVATDGRSVEDVADEVCRQLGTPPGAATPSWRTIEVPIPGRSYEVVVGAGAARRLDELLPPLPDAAKAFVVTHPGLSHAAAGVIDALTRHGLVVEVVTVPEGEGSKSVAVADQLYSRLADAAAHRWDLVVAVGGGVVCDLAGFVASTYNRGMPLVHVPTSLLAQVDAAVGGKTGVNLPHGKNLVGTFHQPLLVVCDVEFLATLPDEEFTSGLAEVVKHGLIADSDLVDVVEHKTSDLKAREAGVLTEIVARSVAVKAAIVAADEREQSRRAWLNYGHTFAHALEHSEGFGGIRHGEAVALGMMAAAHLARILNRLDDDAVARHRRVLEAAGLPTTAQVDPARLATAWARDKKHKGGVRFVLLKAIGAPEADVQVSAVAVAQALQRLGES